MNKNPVLLYKTLVVGVIVLLFVMSFNPIINGNKWINNSISRYDTIEENNILKSSPRKTFYGTINRYPKFGSYPAYCNYVYFLYPPRELEWEYNKENFNGTIIQFRLLASDNSNHTWNLNKFELHINGVNCSNPNTQSFYRRHLQCYEWEIIWNNLNLNCSGDILFEIIYLDCSWIEYQGDYDGDGDESFHYSHYNPRSFIDGTLNGDYIFDSDKAYICWYIPTDYNPPDAPTKPSGNTSGYICIDHNYSTSTTDPAGLNVSYGWDWDGDYIVDEWTDWYESNETCTIAHNWSDPGDYFISVKAKNTFEEVSNWSSKLNVTMLNHPPYVPSNPIPNDGAKNVPVNASLCWTGGDPDPCDTVTYDVYFSINYPPQQVTWNQTENCYDPYGSGDMQLFEDYYWKVVAWDNHYAVNESSVWHFTTVVNLPPSAPVIDGPNSGKPNTEYDFTFNSTDPDEHDIAEYIVDWGDDSGDETITGPFVSGEEVTGNHSWTSQETFTIKAKAKDIFGTESNWSEFEVKIEIPRSRTVYHPLLMRLFERFPLLEKLLSLLL